MLFVFMLGGKDKSLNKMVPFGRRHDVFSAQMVDRTSQKLHRIGSREAEFDL